VVFQLERGALVPMASAGSPPPSWERLEAAASAAMDKGVPLAVSDGADGGTIVASPLVVQHGPAGALVIETSVRLEPGDDDLELLALFSSQAAIAIRNTHDLERLRSGAVAALGRMATQVAHEAENPLAGLRLYAHHLEETLARAFDLFFTTKATGTGLGMSIARSVINLHGGELTVSSRENYGTRVQARLPLEPVTK